MRGLSIFSVLIGHSLRYGGYWAESFPLDVRIHLEWGAYFGVIVFFVVSGYLITQKFLADDARTRVNLPVFYIQRVGRIFPPLSLLIFVSATWAIANGAPINPEHLYRALLSLLQLDFGAAATGIPHADSWDQLWSLSVEEIFYVFFPLICLLAVTRRAVAMVLLPALALAFVFRLIDRNIWTFFATCDGIAIGCITALYGDRFRLVVRGLARLALHVVAMIALVALYYNLDVRAPWSVTAMAVCAALTILTRPDYQAGLAAALVRPVGVLGFYSYEIYLFHFMIMSALSWMPVIFRDDTGLGISNWLVWAVELGAIVACAVTIEKLWSSPLNAMIRTALTRRLADNVQATAARTTA